MNGTANRPPSRSDFPIGLCAAGFALVDLISLPILLIFLGRPILFGNEAEVIAPLFIGTIGAQLGLLAIWAVVGIQRSALRLPLTLACAAFPYTTLILGLVVAAPYDFQWHEAAASYLLWLPLVFLAVQFPLWIARMATGWCIAHVDQKDELPATGPRQFHLRHLFIATTLVALAFGLASLGVARGEYTRLTTWGILLIGCLACIVWSAFFTLPCLWTAMMAKNWGTSTVVTIAYVLVMTAIVSAIVDLIAGIGQFEELLFYYLLFHGTLAGLMLAALHYVRRCGYVLHAPGPRKTTPP